jgi:hypothetical protein
MEKGMARVKAMKMVKDSESRSFVRRQEQEAGAGPRRRQQAVGRERQSRNGLFASTLLKMESWISIQRFGRNQR